MCENHPSDVPSVGEEELFNSSMLTKGLEASVNLVFSVTGTVVGDMGEPVTIVFVVLIDELS